MQPPPRKGNYAKFLKNLHSEQIAKLLAKNQSECELLEDIRSYIIKKSAIEKSYSEALLKISSAYLNKKSLNIPDIKLSGGEEKWNMWSVWRTVLEENEKLARARLAAVEVFQQQIADDAKVLRAHKLQSARKCVDQLALVQKEVQLSVQDLDKTKKLYFDEEHSAHDVRDKARDIEEKLKKKKGSFFQSITALQKNSAKVTSKREQLEEKSSGARNDYLLCLAATNAHQNRYFVVDLHLAMSTMESSVYDKVAEYLTLLGRTELLTCSAMQNSFTTIRDQAKQLTRDYNLQCIYLFYPVLKQHIQYEFEPCDNDPIDHVTAEHESAAATLSKEARKWATRIARDNNCVRESVRKLQIYNALRESGQKNDPNDPNGPDLETKIEELKQTIRKAETSKAKAEARIECLRMGGVNVEEWLKEAETLNVQEIQRSTSSLSVRTDASGFGGDHPSSDSFYDSDFADADTAAIGGSGGGGGVEKVERDEVEMPVADTSYESAEVDAVLEQERQRIEQMTAGWDDPTRVDWGAEESEDVDEHAQLQRTPSIPLKCTALYSYTAQNPDELTIVENEQLEVVGEGDGDGWLKARNYRGEEGYVPHNYLDVEREQPSSAHGLTNQISFSSVDYTVENEAEQPPPSMPPPPPEPIQEVVQAPVKEYEPTFAETTPEKVQETKKPPTVSYCIALYDYDGEEDEELTFDEGQVIKVISKCAHDVDDGWWRGELDGRVGNFPSLVVEECDEFGEPITNQWEETPPCSAPPVCTPPEVPEHLIAEIFVEELMSPGDSVTTPTLTITEIKTTPSGGFEMEMSTMQREQYGSQFGGNVPTIGVIEEEEIEESDKHEIKKPAEDYGLGVAQIVITAATPMTEEPDQPFPPPEDGVVVNHTSIEEEAKDDDGEPGMKQKDTESQRVIVEEPTAAAEEEDVDLKTGAAEEKEVVEDVVAESAVVVSSSTGSDGETTGPSTAENSVSHAPPPMEDVTEPKQVVGGRASIPDELEPHQLACLQNLKESNA